MTSWITNKASRVLVWTTILAATLSAHALPLPPAVGRALGGRTSPDYRPLGNSIRLRRPFSKSSTHPTDAALLNLRTPRNRQAAYLDGAHYRDVRDVGLELMKMCPPESHFYIGIGRSPVAIVTFLRELNDSMAMTFPASDMRLEINPEWEQLYFEHFAALIPEDVLQGKRTIVLFDRSRHQSGTSLQKLKGFLRDYLKSLGLRAKVKAIGMAPGGPLVDGVELIDTTNHPNVFKYVQGADDDEVVAPFPNKHRIGMQTLEQLTENPHYQPFRDAMHNRMKTDADLDRVLKDTFGELVDGKHQDETDQE